MPKGRCRFFHGKMTYFPRQWRQDLGNNRVCFPTRHFSTKVGEGLEDSRARVHFTVVKRGTFRPDVDFTLVKCHTSWAKGARTSETPRYSRPGQVRRSQARPGQARRGQARAGARTSEARRGEARPDQARRGHARPGQARRGQARRGEARPGQVRPN